MFRLMLLLLALLPLGRAERAAARPAQSLQRPAAIPFFYEDARIYVPVRINRGAPHWFILDTGATGTIIDTALAQQAGLALSGGQIVHGAGSGNSQQAHTSAVRFLVG